MGEQEKTMGNSKMPAMILALIGIIVAIVGLAIIVVPHAPGRGSGIGTISLVLGVLILLFGLYRFNRAK
ncbi:MAG TPA: hypothetical protein VMD05_01090 [Candidatus Nanoarchaeia archaeon]|nr:hypothetical protein [Candidatus Nanoarchaeia archaeon]